MILQDLNGLPLAFNIQGGICGESTSKFDYKIFPVAFKSKCLIINAAPTIEQYVVNAWARAINLTKFISGIDNDYNGYYASNSIRYIALGI